VGFSHKSDAQLVTEALWSVKSNIKKLYKNYN